MSATISNIGLSIPPIETGHLPRHYKEAVVIAEDFRRYSFRFYEVEEFPRDSSVPSIRFIVEIMLPTILKHTSSALLI